jgi:hypothetical protein
MLEEPKSTLEYYLQHATDRTKVQETIDRLVERGGLGTQSPELAQLGAIAYINEIIQGVEAVAEHLPGTIAELWQVEKDFREEDRVKFLNDIKAAAKMSSFSQSMKTTTQDLPQSKLLWGAGGICLGMAITAIACNFVFYPAQLRSALGVNGIAIEWLGTPEGELVRKAVKDEGLSLKGCVKTASQKGIPPNSKKDIPCLFFIKK